MLRIYHNPRCSKSRAALLYLQDCGEEIEIIEYLNDRLSIEKLNELLEKLDCRASDLVRRGEDEFKDNNLKEADEEQMLEALLQYPKLIERPIIEAEDGAVIARPLERLIEFLESKND